MSTESKEHVLSRLDAAWPAFRALIASVPDSEFDTPGVTDDWSLKELLGHVIFWAEKAAHDVTVSAQGNLDAIKAPSGGPNVDQLNADAAAKGKAMTAVEAKAAATRAHDAARKAVVEAPESALAPVVSGWTVGVRFAEDTYRHYEEHAKQIKAWMRQLETSEA